MGREGWDKIGRVGLGVKGRMGWEGCEGINGKEVMG